MPYKHLINEEYKNAIKGYRIFAAVGIDNAFRGMRSDGGEETEETEEEKLMKRTTKMKDGQDEEGWPRG